MENNNLIDSQFLYEVVEESTKCNTSAPYSKRYDLCNFKGCKKMYPFSK
jgi:hypothetical protein